MIFIFSNKMHFDFLWVGPIWFYVPHMYTVYTQVMGQKFNKICDKLYIVYTVYFFGKTASHKTYTCQYNLYNIIYFRMPKRGRSKFYQLSSRSKRRWVNKNDAREEGCSNWPDNESSETSYTDNNNSAVHNIDILVEDLESTSSYNSSDNAVEDSSLDNYLNSPFNHYFETTNNNKGSSGIENFLRGWGIKHNVTASAVSDLLVGLKENVDSLTNILPSDSRTLFKTNLILEKISVEPGNYIHFGLKTQLNHLVKNCNLSNIKELKLIVNVDGLPLFKSSPGQATPILVSVVNVPNLKKIVFPVGLYYGCQKPDDMNIFLQSFVTELISISGEGLLIADRSIPVQVIGIVCDAPAKKDILGIKGHGGYFSCTRCTICGITINNKRVFIEFDCTKRTNNDFINQTDPNYQLKNTILTQIQGIDFVHSIVLDVMHLVYLGVMRTMLTTWYDGQRPFKLSRHMIERISNCLVSERLPVEFARQPRDLKYLLRWKATEFRAFLLYLGPIVLKGILDREKYDNFMTLNVALSILLNPKNIRDDSLRNYARSLLIHFVQTFMNVYDESFITHNFHGLIHLVDDADYFSRLIVDNEFNLESISAFQFENYLQKIKNMVRGKNRPLEQIGNRMAEMFLITSSSFSSDFIHNPICSQTHSNGPLLPNCINPQYKTITFKNFKIKIEPPNHCCGTKSGDIIMVENICFFEDLNNCVIIGRKFLRRKNFFSIPCESSSIGVYKVKLLSDIKIWPVTEIIMKYVCFSYKHSFVVFPLLHTN